MARNELGTFTVEVKNNNKLLAFAAVVFFLVSFGFVVRDYVLPAPTDHKEMLNSRFTMSQDGCIMVLECR